MAKEPGWLITWDVIAEYCGCSRWTAMRWHKEMDMPVHRYPGKKFYGQSRVAAVPRQLDEWLALSEDERRAGK